jgi:NADH:ubiquinone oxidoreductase subunit 2 (subunit N)
MYTGLQHAHSGLAYLVLTALIVVIFLMLIGSLSGREFTEKDRKIALIAFILSHVQLLLGLILYFVSPVGLSLLQGGGAMSDPAARLTALEHPLINIVAIVLITIGYSRAKKAQTSRAKFRSIYMLYAVGLVLILSRIPWGAWLG